LKATKPPNLNVRCLALLGRRQILGDVNGQKSEKPNGIDPRLSTS
jgi:hypothetical protein